MNYTGYGYNPEFAPQLAQAGFSGQIGQTMRSPVKTPQNGPGWLFVPSGRDAVNVSVPPGQTAWIMAQNEPVFAVRAADVTGVVTTKYFRFEEISLDAPPAVSPGNYVTREEFQAFVDSLSAAANKRSRKGGEENE